MLLTLKVLDGLLGMLELGCEGHRRRGLAGTTLRLMHLAIRSSGPSFLFSLAGNFLILPTLKMKFLLGIIQWVILEPKLMNVYILESHPRVL